VSDREHTIRKLEEQAHALGLSREQVKKMKEAILSSEDSGSSPKESQIPVASSQGVPFGQYALIERLGNGVLSKMYKALSPEGEEVVLKIMRPDFMKAPFLDRFVEVSTKMVDVFHPNWIISHEVIREPGLALVGEYLDGAPFSINDEPVPIEAVAFILREILTGLSYLHERNEYHGNLKPSNVILCRDGAVKLLDWGMHKVLNAPREKISSVWYGTLSHMAPETHHGDWGPKGDIYSAGLLAWELLAGRPACPHQNIDAQRRWHSSMGPMGIELVRSEIPSWLVSILTSMCARDVELRPKNAMEILDRWQEADTPLPEEEPPETAQIPFRPPPVNSISERPRARRRRERMKERRSGDKTKLEPVSLTPKRVTRKKRTKPQERVPDPRIRTESTVQISPPRPEPRKRVPQLDSTVFFSSLSTVFQEQTLSMNLPNGIVKLSKDRPLLLTEAISNNGFVGSLISLELEFSTLGPRGYVLLSYDLIHNLFNRYSDRDASLKHATRKTVISHADRRSLDRFIAPVLERIQKYFPSVVVHSARLSVPDTQGERQVGIMQVGVEGDTYGFLAVGIPTDFFSPSEEASKSTSGGFLEEGNLMEELLDVSVSMRCALPSFQLSYQSLQELQVGSILPLPKNWNKHLRVIINNKQNFSGEYGVDEGFHAVLIHTQHRPKK
jgi:serine/threonine protein kinase